MTPRILILSMVKAFLKLSTCYLVIFILASFLPLLSVSLLFYWVISLIPLPLILILNICNSKLHPFFAIALTMLFSLIATYFIMELKAPEDVQIIGETIIIIHDSPSLYESVQVESYFIPALLIFASIALYFSELKGKLNSL